MFLGTALKSEDERKFLPRPNGKHIVVQPHENVFACVLDGLFFFPPLFSRRRSINTRLLYWAASRHRLFLYWPVSRCACGREGVSPDLPLPGWEAADWQRRWPSGGRSPSWLWWATLPGLLRSGLEGGWDRWRGEVVRRALGWGRAGFPPRWCGWSHLGRASWPRRRSWRHGWAKRSMGRWRLLPGMFAKAVVFVVLWLGPIV